MKVLNPLNPKNNNALPVGTKAADIGGLPVGTKPADIGALPVDAKPADIGALPATGTAESAKSLTTTLPINKGGSGQTAVTSGSMTRNTTNTKSLTGFWYKWGPIVIAGITATIADSCTNTYSDYVIATGLPKPKALFDALSTISVDGVTQEPWFKLTTDGSLHISPRMTSVAGKIINGNFVYLTS